jgi:DNA-binding NarL/FixJ family response regulator
MTVFIVDDSAIIRERLKTMLSEIPEVKIAGEAKDTSEATTSILRLKPNVVILDIRISEGNGIEVLNDIKQTNDAPMVIMLTNYPYPQYRKKCTEKGADFFFDKSTEFDKINDVLKKNIVLGGYNNHIYK